MSHTITLGDVLMTGLAIGGLFIFGIVIIKIAEAIGDGFSH